MRDRGRIEIVLVSTAIGLFIIIFFFPVFWMILTSFKGSILIGGSAKFIFRPVLENYRMVVADWEIMSFFKNSLIVTLFSTLITLLAGTLAAYSLVRLKPAGKDFIAFEFLSLRAIPPIVALIPIFLLGKILHLQGTLVLLIVVYATINLPISVWMMAGFLKEVPVAIEESALIDGCTRLGVFTKICLPLILPGLIATGIICAIFAWNEFMFANILTVRETKTLPVIAAMSMKHYSIAWGAAAAAGVICAIPVIILGIAAQKYLVRGLTFGAVK